MTWGESAGAALAAGKQASTVDYGLCTTNRQSLASPCLAYKRFALLISVQVD